MARRRFQTGCLTKLGKRRKIWVIRWREDVLRADGTVGRIQRAEMIGAVAELPNCRDALAKMEERLREVNLGTAKPESTMTFEAFVETRGRYWRSRTSRRQRSTGTRRFSTCSVTRLADVEAPRDRPGGDPAVGRRSVSQKHRLADGSERLDVLSSILETAVEFGYVERATRHEV